MIRENEVYKIGRLGKPHGVKGEITFMFDDDVFDRVDADYIVLLIDGILIPFYIEEYRFRSSETALLKLCDIDTQDKARELTNIDVYFPRCMSDSGDTGMTMSEIVGFRLADSGTGNSIGCIVGIDATTANVLLEVETEGGDRVLIPAADEFMTHIDIERKQIMVELPEGLLNL